MKILYLHHDQLIIGAQHHDGFLLIGEARLLQLLRSIESTYQLGGGLDLQVVSALERRDGFAKIYVPGLYSEVIVKRQPACDYESLRAYSVTTSIGHEPIWEALKALGWPEDEHYPAVAWRNIRQSFTAVPASQRVCVDLASSGGVYDQVEKILGQSTTPKQVVYALAATTPTDNGIAYGPGLVYELDDYRLAVRIEDLAPIQYNADGASVPTWDNMFSYIHASVVSVTAPSLVFKWLPLQGQDCFSTRQLRAVRIHHEEVWAAIHQMRRQAV